MEASAYGPIPPRLHHDFSAVRVYSEKEEAGGDIPLIVRDVLHSPGRPLDTDTRGFMEPRFQHDFSTVRVHTDARAAEAARAVKSMAFTAGSHIVFASAAYAPRTPRGRLLLAHELVHVLQNQGGSMQANVALYSGVHDGAERQADRIVQRFSLGLSAGLWTPVSPSALLSRVPENWYRGEVEGVQAAKDAAPGTRGVVHDLGGGTYFTDRRDVAETYANKSGSNNAAPKRVVGGEIAPKNLGRVLDLTEHPEFMKIYEALQKILPNHVSGEPYRNTLEHFLKQKGLKLEDFDIIIGPEGVNGGRQMCIRNPEVLAKVRATMQLVNTGGGAPGAPPSGKPPPIGQGFVSRPGEGPGVKSPAGNVGPLAEQGATPSVNATANAAAGQNKVMPGVVAAVKVLGPMLLHMINRYFMAKEESERALVAIHAKVASADVQGRIAELVDRQRLEIAHRQYRGGRVYVTVSMKLAFTDDVRNTLSLSGLKLSNIDESSFTTTVMSHSPILGSEETMWWVDVSLPVEQVEVSRLEDIKLRLDMLDEQASASASIAPEVIAELNRERNRLLDEKRKLEQEEARGRKEEIGRPSVIVDSQERAQQQAEISGQLRRLEEKRQATAPKRPTATPRPQALHPPSLGPRLPEQQPQLLPGGTGESPIARATRIVKQAEDWARQLDQMGSTLVSRLGSNHSPTGQERQAFLDEELGWRLSVKYSMNKFQEMSRSEAVTGLGELLDRWGPRLAQIRIHLGGD